MGDKIRAGEWPKEKAWWGGGRTPRALAPGSEIAHRTSHPIEAGAQGLASPGERGHKDLSFTLTYLQASPSRKAEEKGGRQEGVISLPRSAPTVSTWATGNNPERVSKARRNSDIVVAR